MGSIRQQQKRPEARGPAATPVRRAAGPAKAGPSPRYGFAPVSPRYGFAPSPRHGFTPSNGLPEPLKTNMEAMSGMALDDVRVHRNSSKPAALGALAYTQGAEIHLGAGQERHLPHEAWHVVQQKQGRVAATRQLKGIGINEDAGLEREADVMGSRASRAIDQGLSASAPSDIRARTGQRVLQAVAYGPLTPEGWGTEMKAMLYPNPPAGSAPSVWPPNWPIHPVNADQLAARDYVRSKIVRGHLLNQQLGGPGNDLRNLTPITKSTNSTHAAKVESHVKDLVLNQNRAVEYHVRANYGLPAVFPDLGGAPASVTLQNLTLQMPYEIYTDYTAWRWTGAGWVKDVGNTPATAMEIKNEGKLYGPY